MPADNAANVQHVAKCKEHGIAACTVCNPKAFGGPQDPHAAPVRGCGETPTPAKPCPWCLLVGYILPSCQMCMGIGRIPERKS